MRLLGVLGLREKRVLSVKAEPEEEEHRIPRDRDDGNFSLGWNWNEVEGVFA